jgi:L-lactate dehydrogenase complex protein LldG
VLPEIIAYEQEPGNLVERFAGTLTGIGGRSVVVDTLEAIGPLLPSYFDTSRRVATHVPELAGVAGLVSLDIDPHSFQDIELMLLKVHFGVAENGAVWITEQLMGQRILPFICQHLAVILYSGDIVPTMQQAYERIGEDRYRFGSFIAGPSKTADIEQALVLGAHGPRTMTAFIINS